MTFFKVRTQPCADFFADRDIDFQERGDQGQSVLHEAIAFKRFDIAAALIARRVDINAQNKKGETPLHYVTMFGSRELLAQLLAAGADPNLTDRFGNGPVWYAGTFTRGTYESVSLLVRHGADVSRKNAAGRSLLDFAQQSGNKELWCAAGGKPHEFKTI